MNPIDPARSRLGELLVAAGLARADAVEAAATRQLSSGLKIGEQLVRDGAVSEADLGVVLSFQLGVPLIALARVGSEDAALALVAEDFARTAGVLPLRVDEARLVVAMCDPADDATRASLAQSTGRAVEPVLALRSELDGLTAQRYAALRSRSAASATVPAERLISFVLGEAFRQGASDIHFEPDEHELRVRLRVDGALRELSRLPRELAGPIAAVLWAMTGDPSTPDHRPLEAALRVRDGGRTVRARLSSVATLWGEAAVLRLFEPSRAPLFLGDLGMESGVLERTSELLGSSHGLILVAGLLGAGKTTTLYACLRAIDRAQRKVVSIEDPVEQVLEGVRQVPAGHGADASPTTWSAVLRQEPDVILLDDLRSGERVAAVAEAALAGRLVLSSVLAGDAVAGLARLLSFGAAPHELGASVTAVLGQQLVRTLCTLCKTERRPDVLEAALLLQAHVSAESVWSAPGCSACSGTGYRGRTGMFELLLPSEGVRAAINESAPSARIREAAVAAGLVTMREAGLRLAAEGRTSVREVISRLPVVG